MIITIIIVTTILIVVVAKAGNKCKREIDDYYDEISNY
jgi:hypothetical protein